METTERDRLEHEIIVRDWEIARLRKIIMEGAYPIEQMRQSVISLYPDMDGIDRAIWGMRYRMAALLRWHADALAVLRDRDDITI